MDTVIGLGGIGCRIASRFESYPQYKIYKMDTLESSEKNYFRIEKKDRPEDYEASSPKVKTFLRRVSGEVLFILSGSSSAAAASLAILEQIHRKAEINILYIQPELSLLSEVKELQERVVFNVLQQYTRSGVFKRMYLISNEKIDPLIEDASITEYHNSINDMIVGAFHMLNVFNHTSALNDTFSPPMEVSRIATLGMLNTNNGEEKMFFPLDLTRETRYYYGIPEKKIKREKKLHRKIINQVKEKTGKDIKISFGIYSTNYDHDCGYVLSFHQKYKKALDNPSTI